MAIDYEKYYENYIEEATKQLREHNQRIIEETAKDFFKLMDGKLRNIFETVITQFYSSYTPLYYKRRGSRGSLYKLLQTSYSDIHWEGEFDPGEIVSRTGYNAENGLYDVIFRQGWHGGAKHNGSYYWRKPIPIWTRWGREAEKATIAPLAMFQSLVKEYREKELQKDWDKLYKINEKKV